VALTAFTSSTAAILILDEQTLLAMRTWLAGDLAGYAGRRCTAALVAAMGLVLALWVAPALNMLALGDQVATGLGSLVRTRGLGLVAIALLCGAAVSWPGRSVYRPGAAPCAPFCHR
jgi:iron complex transport system permease protein